MTGVRSALIEQARQAGPTRLLEVGCGTGHWLTCLRAEGHTVVGCDYSWGMLQENTRKELPRHMLVRGDAGHLAFADGVFEMVLCLNALHHFRDKRRFLAETRRVLAPNGSLVLIGMNPRDCAERWYVYDYFDGVWDWDLARFPAWDQVETWMTESDFTHIERRIVEQFGDVYADDKVFDDPFLRKENCSQLAWLTDEAYQHGLRRMRQAIATARTEGRHISFPYEITMTMLTGVAC